MGLTVAALDAVPGLAALFGGVGVGALGAGLVVVQGQVVHGAEDGGDVDFLGTSVHAVLTGGAGNGGQAVEDVHHLLHGGALGLVQGLEVLHVGDVVVELLLGGHAGKHGEHALQGGGVADGPRGHAHLRLGLFKDLLHLGRHNGQRPAPHRLHDDDGLVVLAGHLVALAGLDAFALPVHIVDLQLDKLHLRVGLEDALQHLSGVVEGETDVLYAALLLQPFYKVPAAKGVHLFHHFRV